jgi:hypothetical protein
MPDDDGNRSCSIHRSVYDGAHSCVDTFVYGLVDLSCKIRARAKYVRKFFAQTVEAVSEDALDAQARITSITAPSSRR